MVFCWTWCWPRHKEPVVHNLPVLSPGDQPSEFLSRRTFQHTPWTYPSPPTNSLWFGISWSIRWWKGTVWGMLQGGVLGFSLMTPSHPCPWWLFVLFRGMFVGWIRNLADWWVQSILSGCTLYKYSSYRFMVLYLKYSMYIHI